MDSQVNVLERIEKIVKHPLYYLVGIASDRLIYQSTEGDIVNLWSSTLDGGDRIKLTREGLFEVARPRRKDKYIVFTRDVAKGHEKHKVFIVDVYGKEGIRSIDMEPLRIFGIAVHGETIIYSGSTEKDIGLYISKGYEKPEKLYGTDRFFFVTDTNRDMTVGYGNLHGNPRSYELFIYIHRSSEMLIYTPKKGSINERPIIIGDKILFASNYRDGHKSLYIYDPINGKITEPSFRYSDYRELDITDYINYGSTQDGLIWFIGLSNARGHAFVDGKAVRHPPGTPGNIEIHDDTVYMHFSTLKQPQAIYRTSLKGGGWERIIGEDLPRDIGSMMGDIEITSYKSFDGLEIPCIIFESNIEKPGPTIIFVHGGPWSYVGDYWRAFISALVASGYHVVAPNFRGSTGYGEEFRLLDIGDPGGGDLMDVVYAAKYARDTGLASKLAIVGYSYGGYMTLLATVKEPGIWRCGVAGAGIADWEESYKLSDAIFRQFINVLFAGDLSKLKERSPITYIENLKAPLCIIHPQNDTRTPLKPIIRYCEKLLELGKTFELHVLPSIGHIIDRPDDLVKILFPAITFLNRYM